MKDDIVVSSEIYEILTSADWETLGKKMLARATWRGSTHYRITCTTIFARGYSIEDVVSQIIQSVFEGRRKWNPDEISLEDWLLNQIDSVMDWWLKLVENKDLLYEEFENAEQKDDHETNNTKSIELETVLQYGPPDPETILIKTLDEDQAKELYNALFDNTSDDPELQDVILAMIDADDSKPSNIAKQLGVPVEEIYNRKKRLKRRLDEVLTSLRKSLP